MTDLAIIGAGPAGMSAAIEAAALGLSVTVIDEQPAPGGQIFRGVEQAGRDPALAGEYAAEGAALARRFRATPGIDYRPATTLWHLDTEAGLLSLRGDDGTGTLAASRVLLATGAQERPVPIPGWTLPNVMTAGAAQILLKQAGAVPHGRTVLAGQGPLLWLLAGQLARAGAPPALLLETTPRGALGPALRAGGLWRGRAMLAKGAGLMLAARAAGMRVIRHVTGLRAEGDGILRRVTWDGGSTEAGTLLLHEGVIPSTHISRALGLPHHWDEAQLCWRPEADAWGATPHPLLAVAGDGAGIGGWQAAMAGGALAALDAAHRLGRLAEHARDSRAVPHRARLAAALALRPFLDRLYAPAPGLLAPPEDATIVCRCEEITAGEVRAAARLGATGPNQAKAYLRTGMGPCQGRVCGTILSALIAETRGVPVAEAGALRPRAPFKPITVGELASLPVD
ncbi:NAD(P)/FAD-dependent oxidoreductase [Roseomonas marmotae]|uniref:FAD-dependent oxidoreductase n=1 Tax=Roseomonas marmotae TaxID=2768161 RepID=A0ABS3KFT7_9PROT|nr:NAD(P)/FAD-dependent oxidoreductase [Roseomonas marmotae]MBO1076334.1 FAD-dependent oxidoreductase [Roseomonas marmotae]QTI80569.1 FAD-dependent oxidoreductase [Roseomonas marmotae]